MKNRVEIFIEDIAEVWSLLPEEDLKKLEIKSKERVITFRQQMERRYRNLPFNEYYVSDAIQSFIEIFNGAECQSKINQLIVAKTNILGLRDPKMWLDIENFQMATIRETKSDNDKVGDTRNMSYDLNTETRDKKDGNVNATNIKSKQGMSDNNSLLVTSESTAEQVKYAKGLLDVSDTETVIPVNSLSINAQSQLQAETKQTTSKVSENTVGGNLSNTVSKLTNESKTIGGIISNKVSGNMAEISLKQMSVKISNLNKEIIDLFDVLFGILTI